MAEGEQDFEALFERFRDFSRRTYHGAGPADYLVKLREEVGELEQHTCLEELADCMLVLVGLSRFLEGDLKEVLRRKIELNESRRWERQPDGSYHHI